MSRPWTPRRTRDRVLLVAVLVALCALFLATVPAHRGFFDVGVYRGAVTYWLRDGGQLYDYLRPGTRYGFTYPPFAALVMSPLSLLNWPAAIATSIAVNVAAAALVIYWLLDPIARRRGWPRWYAFALTGCAVAIFEPVRDTVSFGQVNLLLLMLVLADVMVSRTGRGRLSGIGIGLASAIKLTPVVFIGYLVLSGRWRAAAVATGTAATATGVAALLAPHSSYVFWTEALWNTDRVGDLGYVSNQSLQGVLTRWDPHLGRGTWLAVVLVVGVLWAVRVRQAARAGDQLAGAALTGIVGCLVSPITWVHHLVWLLPALAVLGGAAVDAGPGRRRRRLGTATAVAYVLLCSSVVWLWWNDASGVDGLIGSNAYVWIGLALLVGLPIGRQAVGEVEQRQPVAVDAQPGDHTGGDRGDNRVVPELLPGVDVGDVHLDQRGSEQGAGVPDRVRVM
ncbi:alpha-1,2-mannosyltransferase [Micromonospora pisi]|uniref:Alpha-1,2-mannosyltransferase n=1 Tax=Micromonospora pisi TaxID=589240 RepID=A0A495JRR2_9ACTN|nr:alpha-1,2-mannosyltransferase [Micromonospora pisi]